MTSRPQSITIIGWLIIISGIAAIINLVRFSLGHADLPTISPSFLPPAALYSMTNYGIALTFIAGLAILDGMNWGRWLYVLKSIISLGLLALTSHANLYLIISIIMFLLVTAFLFSNKANAYFSGSAP